MGCSGSKAGGAAGPSAKKFDPNVVIKAAGQEPLNKKQCTAFMALHGEITKIAMNPTNEERVGEDLKFFEVDQNEAQQEAFTTKQAEGSDKLNQESTVAFCMGIFGDDNVFATVEITQLMFNACNSLDAAAPDMISFADFVRAKSICYALLKHSKEEAEKAAAAAAATVQAPSRMAAAAQGEPLAIEDAQPESNQVE